MSSCVHQHVAAPHHSNSETHLHWSAPRNPRPPGVRLRGVLSLAKLAGPDQRYYLEQAQGRVDHAGSVASGVEDYYLSGPEAAGSWVGSATAALGLTRDVSEDD